MTDYQPIDGTSYSNYELAILQRRRLRLSWRGPDGLHHVETLLPEDLRARDGAEYLIASGEDGGHRELRLDWIVASDPPP